MRVLVACENSGVVRNAFSLLGHDAWSCDLLSSELPGNHIKADVKTIIKDDWDLVIAHPPCTYICVSGYHWTVRGKRDPRLTDEALDLVRFFMECGVQKIAIENPVSIISSRIRKPDQIIQPFQFGHPESKKTCLWLKNLPLLVATKVLPLPSSGRWENQTVSGQNKLSPSSDRWKVRSKTYNGIADAMACQWGGVG